MGQLIGYARSSTEDQEAGFDAQLRDLKAAGCTKIFKEMVSSVGDRAELERALDYVRAGDTLVVTTLTRLARNARGLWDIIDRLDAVADGGAGLRILDLGGSVIDTRGATGRLILTIFSGVAQWERESMLERQREGIAKARVEGKYRGRAPTARAKASEAVAMFKAGMSKAAIAEQLGIGRASVLRAVRAGNLGRSQSN
jgi:DNA invertase Pin-like site-specific DNA recombinase